jgi:lysozyme
MKSEEEAKLLISKLSSKFKSLENAFTEFVELYGKKEDSDSRHRIFNTAVVIVAIVLSVVAYFKVPEMQFEKDYKNEIAQLVEDEGLRLEVYDDTLANPTIGFGHLVKQGEQFGKITPHEAIALLINDYAIARDSVESRYSWADGDVKLVLINMTYQMGPARLAKFEKAIGALRDGNYKLAAAELLDSAWAKQTPKRAQRLAGRILQLDATLF